MTRVISLRDALRCAVLTAQDQPREVPNAPPGWLADATRVLADEDAEGIRVQALAVSRAHNQYRAEFDIKGWLYDLRNAQFEDKKANPAPGVPAA